MKLETLEDRTCPDATSFLNGGVLTSLVTGTASYDIANGVLTVGNQSFDSTLVTQIVALGSPGRDVIQNNTNIASILLGGDGKDTLFGGNGLNTIDGGGGDDLVYALLGTNTINSQDGVGNERVFTNNGAVVSSDLTDIVVRFFAPGRTPGTPYINQEADGVLYITPGNGGSSTILLPGPVAKSITAVYNLSPTLTGIKTFFNVKAISYFGGSGNDVYTNLTNIDEAAYGSAGNDLLISGTGRVLLKGSGGDDTLIGRGTENDISGNGGRDLIFATNGFGKNTFRTDAQDLVFGSFLLDVFISP